MTQKHNSSAAKSGSPVGVQSNHSTSLSVDSLHRRKQAARPRSVELAGTDGDGAGDGAIAVGQRRRIPLPSWHFLGILLILLSGGVGFVATSILLSFNGSSNCSALYIPLASATTRLYCAQLEAEKQTLASYLKAIRMVDGFPQDHPLRPDIDRNIEVWTSDILVLAESKFQEGKLDEAIAMAEEIPVDSTARTLAEDAINRWREIWREGETILAQMKRELDDGDLNQAMRTAVQLSYLENRYWSTEKYEEARNQIQLARKETGELDVAFASFRRGGIENWLKAIDQASNISKDSYAYRQAQNLIDDARQEIIRYVNNLVEQRRWNELMTLSDRLPSRLNIDSMVMDWKIIAQAGIQAQKGSVADLEAALIQIQSIQPSSSVYDSAQDLTQRWQKEITDVALLEQGRSIAGGGSIAELERAIAKLNLIEEDNPRYGEARKQIAQWREKIQITEDRPILEYAKDLAASNRTDSLNEAILQARSIEAGRALYGEAQENIRKWQAILQRRTDQPIFDRAVALGSQKQYSQAIAVANQISAGRALYPEMQEQVKGWRQELNAINKLQSAYQSASQGTVSGLVEAIRLVQDIPNTASNKQEGRTAANQWSYGILNEAQRISSRSIPEAIATARLIPRNTEAYSAAQTQIEAWQRILRPAESNIPLSSP